MRITKRKKKGGRVAETGVPQRGNRFVVESIETTRGGVKQGQAQGRLVLSRNTRLEAVILPIEECEGIPGRP